MGELPKLLVFYLYIYIIVGTFEDQGSNQLPDVWFDSVDGAVLPLKNG